MSITELEIEIYRKILEEGRDRLKQSLEQMDVSICAERNTSRYRNKGFGKSCIKTIMGAVEFERRRYLDKETQEYVYLLDEELGLKEFGKISPMMAVASVKLSSESTYRNAARQVEELTGLNVSHQTVWDVTQKVGKRLRNKTTGEGIKETAILFEEADGIWLNLQGKDRKENGSTKEMKIAIAYEGTRKTGKRRECAGKIAHAGFEDLNEFREKTEETIRSDYKTDTVKMRVLNGDGANWIFNRKDDVVTQLDVFHRNKAVVRNIKQPEIRKLIFKQLYTKDIDGAIDTIEMALNSTDNENELKNITELLQYFKNNKERLVTYNRRGLDVPEINTGLEYPKLGAMESNVFTLIGNRMKGKRKCWTIAGANNMAAILCLKHTGKLNEALKETDLPVLAKEAEEPEIQRIPIPEKTGTGYNGYKHASLQGYEWLRYYTDYDFFKMKN